ncbi:ROK family transcriptional regulator [Actinacidiphila acidipaludis]|uniref:ROK family transcriptional regulator n=1 Tax=Actinacidiphila acidipaludis TaxID=2873382 RepID=A0ABS7Q7V6_9ACTN|nr:ROK family transcriptional regulator [Streptomyces acidipaludis]MBY8879247.1 ROK family transcriptional regulator [Streptomyces acidipaludis]
MRPSASGANLPALRSHNAALLLDLLRAATLTGGTALSRPDLAERTGLTPQAVSKITARLREEGLVEEAGRLPSTGGKPSTGLRLAAGSRYAVGVHLDGETLTAVLTDLAGRTVAERSAPLSLDRPVAEGLAAVTAQVRGAVALAPGPVLGVGVGMRGPLDHRTGVLHRVTGFPHWAGVPLRDELAARLGLPVAVDKNTNTAALAVLAAPPGAQYPSAGAPAPGPGGESFAYLHLGTGLGAALVLDGTLHRGGRTGAGEFGHQAVQLDGPLCPCGNRGCLEALCLAAVGRGDPAGAARLLGVGAANLVALLDVDRIVLGGGTVRAAPEVFRRETAAVLAERGRGVPVTTAAPLAVAEGAALLVLAPLFTHGALAGS